MSKQSRKKSHDGSYDGDNAKNEFRSRNGSAVTLGPYTDAARIALDNLAKAEESLRGLSSTYRSHIEEIGQAGQWRERCSILEKRVVDQEADIVECNTTIAKLTRLNQAEDIRRKEEYQSLQEERAKLEAAQEKVKKRLEALEQQQKRQLDEEMQKLRHAQDEELRARRSRLEDASRKREKDFEKRNGDLQLIADKLSAELEKVRQQNTEQRVRLEQAEEALDDAKRIKKSVAEENRTLQNKLHDIKKSFGLSSRPPEFYTSKFTEIQRQIESISIEFLRVFDPNDIEVDAIHERLRDVDPYFASVPISSSIDSQQLCQAHIQRVISAYMSKYIWKRFSSERTTQYPQLAQALEDILSAVNKHGHPSGRSAAVWKTQTMQALLSLPALVPTRNQGNSVPSRSGRVIAGALSLLKPIIDQTKLPKFKEALLHVCRQAVVVWDLAQVDEMEITIITTLDPAKYPEFRASLYDPIIDSENAVSPVSGQIYTLFPRITAHKQVFDEDSLGVMSEAFKSTDHLPQVLDFLLHPGVGVAKASPLAVRGKTEVDGLYEAIATTKRSWKAGDSSSTPRRPSATGSISQQWMGMKSTTSLTAVQ